MAREKSPLPGWDPYLQRFWRDVHHRLITYSSDLLRRAVPSDLRVRIEERIILEAGDPVLSRDIYVPDVAVFRRPGATKANPVATVSDSRAVAEPMRIKVQAEP